MKRFCLITTLFISFACFAQKQTIIYLKSNGAITTIRDSAVLIRTISDLIPGTNLYPFTEKFVTGALFRMGKTLKPGEISLDGECTIFYPSGSKMSHAIYDHAKAQTDTTYFPNGKVYLVNKYVYHTPDSSKRLAYAVEQLVTACNDSTGKALVTNGNGHFVSYHPQVNGALLPGKPGLIFYNPNNIINEEGDVKNGQKDGLWNAKAPDSKYAYTEEYKDGKLISGQSTDKDGEKYQYTVKEATASFPGGIQAFYNYLGRDTRYPSSARILRVQGKVFLTFIVEKNGKLSNIKVVRGVSADINAEAVRVMQASPQWVPGQQNGIPVRQQYTVPISFTLMN